MPEEDHRQATWPAPGASGQHPVLEGVTEAVRLMDDAAGFLSPTREYDEPGFTGWPRDLDGRETLAMMRQMAGVVDAAPASTQSRTRRNPGSMRSPPCSLPLPGSSTC